MKIQSKEKIINCYNDVADNYATNRINELSNKHLDRLLLKEFASAIKDKGPCADFGCGPGQITKFLHGHGVKNIVGVDISSGMIDTARRISPKIQFETGDLLDLPYSPGYFAGATAFYAIVHLNYDQIKKAFSEINRVLEKGGQFLFSFHAGDKIEHFDKANDIDVDIDLYFFQTDKIMELLHDARFRIVDALERKPYEKVEYPSRRAYIWTEKK